MFEGDFKDKSNSSRPIRVVNFLGVKWRYELIHILEFDSTRKRMSVIVRCLQTQDILVLCKGAEDFVFPLCSTGDISECNTILNSFAVQGWRTLVLAYRKLTQKELDEFNLEFNEAYNDLNNREIRLQDIYKKVESNLTLIGSTAVEDRLQEDVASTLEFLRLAGIKIWVLTGDKKETAINISNSCKHFSTSMERLIATDLDKVEDITNILNLHFKR